MLCAGAARKFKEDAPRGVAVRRPNGPARSSRRGDRIQRRELLLLLGSAMTTAPGVRAQQKAMPVIGFLGTALPPVAFMDAFKRGLSENGYAEGQNLAIEYRWSEGRPDRLPDLVADLVARKVDVIVTAGA